MMKYFEMCDVFLNRGSTADVQCKVSKFNDQMPICGAKRCTYLVHCKKKTKNPKLLGWRTHLKHPKTILYVFGTDVYRYAKIWNDK